MQKIYGYKEEDVKGLIAYIRNRNGRSLTSVFTEYARANGKASGTVRNLYYAIVKKSNEDKNFCDLYLGGKSLSVSKKQAFGEKEERELVTNILREKAKGKSVRKAISELASGDEKKALRYQNKYRLVLKKSPESLREIARDLSEREGILIEVNKKEGAISDFTYLRLKREIDKLVDGISSKIKRENQYLKKRINYLESENLKLSAILYGEGERVSNTRGYFDKISLVRPIEKQ